MLRAGVRLVILDEPFQGLERHQRHELLSRARKLWRDATLLLCITHDLAATKTFERALVVERGRVVEDGHPAELSAQPASRYQAMLAVEQESQEGIWSASQWRRLRLERAELTESVSRVRAW